MHDAAHLVTAATPAKHAFIVSLAWAPRICTRSTTECCRITVASLRSGTVDRYCRYTPRLLGECRKVNGRETVVAGKEFDYVVLGASGHVGTALLDCVDKEAKVLALVHSHKGVAQVASRGVEATMVNICDTDALRSAFQRGRRAFLLNPPADPASDTNAEELRTAALIAAGLTDSRLEKVVALSTYGAQPGDSIGDLSTLYEFEELVRRSGIPSSINRGAYYFTNLDMMLQSAQAGTITTPFPPHLEIPMVAAADLAKAAAERLVSGTSDVGIRFVEGPARYTFTDVAAAFSNALGHVVLVEEMARAEIENSFCNAGFSPAAARSYARMTTTSIDGGFEVPDDPWRGTVELEDYVANLVYQQSKLNNV